MSIKVRIAVIILGVAAIVFSVYGGYRNYERDQRTALIHHRQEDLQSRLDALRSEMQTPTSDPTEIKARKDRLSELQKDLDSLKRDAASQSGN